MVRLPTEASGFQVICLVPVLFLHRFCSSLFIKCLLPGLPLFLGLNTIGPSHRHGVFLVLVTMSPVCFVLRTTPTNVTEPNVGKVLNSDRYELFLYFKLILTTIFPTKSIGDVLHAQVVGVVIHVAHSLFLTIFLMILMFIDMLCFIYSIFSFIWSSNAVHQQIPRVLT